MKFKKILTGLMASVLASTLIFTDVVGATPPAIANTDDPSITLNGTVVEGSPGLLTSKSVIMTSAEEARLNYRLVPNYSTGSTSKVTVTLFLPSLEHTDAGFEVVGRDATPTPMGLQGRVSAGGGWHTPNGTVAQGGTLVLEYIGNLEPGVNPAFDLFLSTYNDGTDGPYGGVPEGTAFDVHGYVTYEQYNGQGEGWETLGRDDLDSHVQVIATDLQWEPQFTAWAPNGGTTAVPMWDRFQYFDYVYRLQNTSTNPASNIEAYSVNFDIDTTDNINGIIPTDINRWTYNPGAEPTFNDDADYTEGQFIGVPGEGGILIYDITDVFSSSWDGVTGLGDPLPYSYAGAGMITVDRQFGDNRQQVTPGKERIYMVSLPMSRQGFPNIPTNFYVDAITNIVLGESTNWTKTRTAVREVLNPSYGFDFTHKPEKSETVYATDTYTELNNFTNTSNAPVFNPSIQYNSVENFDLSEVVYLFDAADTERFADTTLSYSYSYTNSRDQVVTVNRELTATPTADPDQAGKMRAVFDVSELEGKQWNRQLHFSDFADRINPGGTIPLAIQVHGTAMEVKTMTFPAVTTYMERYANNEDYTLPTTYAEVPHTVKRDASFRVILPNEVIPRTGVSVNGNSSTSSNYPQTVRWNENATLGFNFGTNNNTAETSTTTITVNTSTREVVSDAKMVIKPSLFASAENVRITVVDLDGVETPIDLSGADLTQPIEVVLPERFANIVVETGDFLTNGAQNFIDVVGIVDAGLTTSHTVNVLTSTYQPAPYDQTASSRANGYLAIQLPAALNPSTSIVGVYGDRRTNDPTYIPYEVPVQAEYRLSTGGVTAPEFTYTITEAAPSKLPAQPTDSSGILIDQKLKLSDAFLAVASDVVVTFVDDAGTEQAFTTSEVEYADITLQNIAKIVISGTNLNIGTAIPVVTIDYDSELDMGASQRVLATFVGAPQTPYIADKIASASHRFEVAETRTTVGIEGVNQVTKAQGAGNSYDQWVDRQRSCGYYCTMTDQTLDQGYKSLGGFVSSIARPGGLNNTNDQTTVIDVKLPHDQFDTYYVKIRNDLQPYIEDVQIFRMVDGVEELWRTVPGSAWVNNTTEGSFWRIGTAHQGVAEADMFTSMASVNDANHPYYKAPFATNVVPDQPVSRVAVTLKFERNDHVSTPELTGTTSRVIEYMGRFFETSEEGKKATAATVEDTFGKKYPITRTHTADPVYSLVHYPFAQTETGAQDAVSLQRKVVMMGTEGHYLASVWNVATQSYGGWHWPHGPDLIVPVFTESDEWMMSYNPEGFHDQLAYKFTYPATPDRDADFNFDPTSITLENTSTLKYFTGVSIASAENEPVQLTLDAAERAEMLAHGSFKVNYNSALPVGFHKISAGLYEVSLGEGVYPTSFEATFNEIAGFGDNTAELQGVAKDSLGANLNEIDVRVGGIVNGNKDLVGKTELFREPNDSARTLVHTSNGVLAGYTPKLGATLDLNFDKLSLYDYAADGITPNQTTVDVGMTNNSEADITAFTLNLDVDTNFRAQEIRIPKTVFAGDWAAKTVTIGQVGGNIPISLDRFTLVGDYYVLDLDALFDDKTLGSNTLNVAAGGSSKLDVRQITKVTVDFAATKSGVRMWGSLARELDPAGNLPNRMMPGSYLFITGDWVDEAINGWTGDRAGWDSKPAARADGVRVDADTRRTGSFTANGLNFVTPQGLWANASNSGNAGSHPDLTKASLSNAPTVYHRTVDLVFRGAHLNDDLTLAKNGYPYDADTQAQVVSTDLVVGDTTKVLYEIRNSALIGEANRNPMFDPSAHFTAPDGMKITNVTVVTKQPEHQQLVDAITELGRTTYDLADSNYTILPSNNDEKSRSVQFNVTLQPQDSVWVYVEYEAINDYSAALDATQNKSVTIRAYATPGIQHHLENYNLSALTGNGVVGATGSSADHNADGFAETSTGLAATYRYANPTVVDVETTFDVESLSGTPMTITVDKLSNQIRHDNTHMVVDVTFDTRARGFVLGELPQPTHAAGYPAPVLTVLVGGDYVTFDPDVHELKDINSIRVDYGIVPAFGADAKDFAVPAFEISGTGWWQNTGGAATKSSIITSTVDIDLTHHDGATEGNPAVALYETADTDSVTIYKGLPQVEFNLQSFDTRDESLAQYDRTKDGKTSYVAGDEVFVKLTAQNANTPASSNTGMGKAPVHDPVIYDKVPEYLVLVNSLDEYVADGTLDVAAAVAAGKLVITHFDANNEAINNAELPTVTVESISGKDVGGNQQFTDSPLAGGVQTDRSGKISATEPTDQGANPAAEVNYQLFTYEFARDLGRGERIEVMYAADIREERLPFATYADGRSVYAPMLGWYGSNDLTSATAHTYDMDMAALLHDAGFSGTRSFEQTAAEFLATSSSWVPGQTRERRVADARTGTYDTYYDASANSQFTHQVYLNEQTDNTLFSSVNGTPDDNFRFVIGARVNDGEVTHDDRILWSQDNLQLSRAWLYGASEMRPDVIRATASGASDANFIEHDGSLAAPGSVTEYTADHYTYAVEQGEQLTVRLHAANLGDRAIISGIEYTEILPIGFNPFDADGNLLGITAYDGFGNPVGFTYEVLQTPEADAGYRAPRQNQEAGTYRDLSADGTTVADTAPYVLRIRVAGPLNGMFNAPSSTVQSKYQHVDVRVRVDEQAVVDAGARRYWFDQLSVSTIDAEEYLALYTKEYGAVHRDPNLYNPDVWPNDGIKPGIDLTDLSWYHWGSNGYTSYSSFEPHGMYVRGLNAQGSISSVGGKPALVTGDQMVMRKPSLRVWNDISKDAYSPNYHSTVQDFTTELNDRLTIHATVENQQIETQSAYHGSTGGRIDAMTNQPQTVGGARGTWFDPTVTVLLPFGVVPVLTDGTPARYTGKVGDQQLVDFTASVNHVTYDSSTPIVDATTGATNMAQHLDLTVERIQSEQGERFVLFFTVKNTPEARAALSKIGYGQSITVSPRAMVIDMPPYRDDESAEDQTKFQEVVTLANSEADVFEPIISGEYATGSTVQRPSGSDQSRLDSTGSDGVNRITERLISSTKKYLQGTEVPMHTTGSWTVPAESLLPSQVQRSDTNFGAYGGTRMVMRFPSVVNSTKVGPYADQATSEVALLGAAAKFWVSTEAHNRPSTSGSDYSNMLNTGAVHNSRFIFTSYVTSFAEKTGEVRLQLGSTVYDRAAFEAMGYTVQAVTEDERLEQTSDRQVVRWIVTPPAPDAETAAGRLNSGERFTLLQEYRLVDGFRDDEPEEGIWTDDNFTIDSYVSLIPDDLALLPEDGNPDNFVVQPLEPIRYSAAVTETAQTGDIDGNGVVGSFLAHNTAEIEVAKPQGEIRVNTTRPRLEYTNGAIGDPYYNSSDTIEYLVTLAKNTGSGLRELVVDTNLPTPVSNDPAHLATKYEIDTALLYVSSGRWEIPADVVALIERNGKTVDQVFETEVYVSRETPETGFAEDAWQSLGTQSITENRVITVPSDLARDQRQVRVVVRSLDADYLVPTGTRLAIDADASKAGNQEVTETDPDNDGTTVFGEGVTGAAIKMGMRASSDVKQTMFIYDTAELWGNYVADAMAKLDSDSVRAYLTPSRPVVNVLHSAEYFRYDATQPASERWGWSDNMAINPASSSHLKFSGEVVNADDSMWTEAESITYSEDMLIDPKVTFELPRVMTVQDNFTYVPHCDDQPALEEGETPTCEVTPEHPLHSEYRSDSPLVKNTTEFQETDAFQWTWKLVSADGTVKQQDSNLKHTRIYSGDWSGLDRNVVTIWFEGQVLPGDKIVIDFIGLIDTYTPGATSEDTKSRVYTTNNTGLVQPLNSDWNAGNRLGYESDRLDLDDNGLLNDRLVFTEQTLFEYEVYDNFGKRKVSYSDLNLAGTTYPRITPVREGGNFNYSLTIDNTKEVGETPYPFPIIYDVLPYADDTAVMNEKVQRNSAGSSTLDLDSFKLVAEGGLKKTFGERDYTIYVGPFTKDGSRVVPTDLLPAATVATEDFYDAMGVGGVASAERSKYFVTLAEYKTAVAADPSLRGTERALLVLFNNPTMVLPGQSKLKLTYDMSTPLNAPAYLETWDVDATPEDVAQWNSFAATQRKEHFKPQESNNAGTFVTEKADQVSIGNYVWHDANFDAEQNEGELFTDVNGRELLRPTKDINFDGTIDDPGINQVKVTLLSPNGRHVDTLGNPIAQVGNQWLVVDDATGEVFVDELNQNIVSGGPLVTTTRTDINGFNGYYVFSNIAPGDYRVMFEMPKEYNEYSVTTQQMLSGADVTTFLPGDTADVHVAHDVAALVAVTDVRTVALDTSDDTRMGFDLGVGHLFDFGGTVWNDDNRDGVINAGEARLPGFTVALKHADGSTVVDANGNELVRVTDSRGEYTFPVLPRDNRYYVEVIHPDGSYDKELPVTPITHADNPFTRLDDNDVTLRETGDALVVRTNLFSFDLRDLFTTSFADRRGVNAGFYEYRNTGVIGNLVWDDTNRNGIQDFGEPGLAGQELSLLQYEQVDGEWIKNDAFAMTTTSVADGLYYFDNVPAFAGDAETGTPFAYQVVANGLLAGYNFAPARVGDDREADSDLFMDGTMRDADGTDHLISLVVQDGRYLRAVDNVTVDLGLIAHDTGVIAGDVFIDGHPAGEPDGLQTDEVLADERFTATLQVSTDGVNWADVASQVGVNAYRFENLAIYSDAERVANQYRVVVTEIPLWLAITAQNNAGDAGDATDSDFSEASREGTFTAVSDTYTLVDPVEGHLLPFDTRTAIDHEDVDLGLVEPHVVIGGTMWEDANQNGLREAGEAALAGRTVVLWELVDGAWVRVQQSGPIGGTLLADTGAGIDPDADPAGDPDAGTDPAPQPNDVVAVTDENGAYRFVVDAMHFDEAHPKFMQPREYRVSHERQGYQVWSPLNVGDDRLVDNDISDDVLGYDVDPAAFGGIHTGISHVFSIIDHVNGVADPLTLRDDIQMDAGLKSFADRAVIGGTIWEDTTEDGLQQGGERPLSGREVTLLERVNGEWIPVADLNGDYTVTTGVDGSYEFVVAPTHWDADHEGYLLAREYRTETETPERHRLSEGAGTTARALGDWNESKLAEFGEFDPETGLIVLSEHSEDRALDYPFVVIPLALTGGGTGTLVALFAVGTLGLGLLLIGIRRKRLEDAATVS